MIKIKLDIRDAVAFFGTKHAISVLLGMTPGAISNWGSGDISQENAFRLAFISKLPEFKRNCEMDYDLIIE